VATPIILSDEDVRQRADMGRAIARVADLLATTHVAPARHRVGFGGTTELVVAAGGSAEIAGMRAYFSRATRHFDDQVVMVWDMASGALRGVIVGHELGVLRMGAIGGVAIDALAPEEAQSLAVIGTGRQARAHIAAAMAVREIRNVRVYGRDASRLQVFAAELAAMHEVEVQAAGSAREAVEGAEIVVLATTSLRPVIEADWLDGCRLIHTVGFKSPAGKEMGLDVPQRAAAIVTDSPAQMAEFGAKFILSGTVHADKVEALADFVTKRRARPDGRVVSYPLGITGSDVVVADEILGGSKPV
jgi:ornithine cyclodeaminase/alanine dehydrogenase-like protein (mu-crystallin family)